MLFTIILGGFCLAFVAILIFIHKKHNRDIAKLGDEIHKILIGQDNYNLQLFKEGKLFILQNEIQKMTIRLREQRDALLKDKQYLADSLADVAHQLRTPLTSANLALSLLSNCGDQTKRQEYIRECETLLMRMDWLITALLKIARLDAGVVEFANKKINIKTLVNSALKPLLIPIELRGVIVKINISETAEIQGDFGWLSEAIENIAKNCMESTGNGGKIEIICSENVLHTELTIRDNGAGFTKNDLPHIFDRFYSTKSSTGYGIGLALSKMILSRQNASITAKNHPNGGAMFIIRFAK